MLESCEIWNQLSMEWLGEELNPHKSYNDIKNDIKNSLYADIKRLLKDSGQLDIPIEPEKIAQRRKVKEVLKTSLESDGLLIPHEDGFIIKINCNMPIVRQRLACAHEIGHTYFYDITKSPPMRFYQRTNDMYWTEEGLAYEIAREILIPSDILKKKVNNSKPPHIEDFKLLSRQFNVSSEILALKIQELNIWNVIFIFFSVANDSFDSVNLQKVIKCGNSKCYSIAPGGIKIQDETLLNIIKNAYTHPEKTNKDSGVDISIGKFKKHIVSMGTTYAGDHPPKVMAILCMDEPTKRTSFKQKDFL